MRFRYSFVLGAAALLLGTSSSDAEIVSPSARAAISDHLVSALNSYVFPDVAARMIAEVKRRRSVYLGISDRDALARTMTDDLRQVSRDKHMNVMAHSELPTEAPSPASKEADAARSASSAYGFTDVRHLPGNIGYVELRAFTDGPEAAAFVESVMTLAGDSDALIVDVRKNHGGLPTVAESLTGYMLDGHKLLFRVHSRLADGRVSIENRYAIPPRSGRKYTRPLYILTSHASFSAAEYFTYGLQSVGRAIVVGEATGGGANTGDVMCGRLPRCKGFVGGVRAVGYRHVYGLCSERCSWP